MYSRSLHAACAAAALLVIWPDSVEARVISRGNPHQFSSVHGINYSSIRWEHRNGSRRGLFGKSSRRSWRRR